MSEDEVSASVPSTCGLIRVRRGGRVSEKYYLVGVTPLALYSDSGRPEVHSLLELTSLDRTYGTTAFEDEVEEYSPVPTPLLFDWREWSKPSLLEYFREHPERLQPRREFYPSPTERRLEG